MPLVPHPGAVPGRMTTFLTDLFKIRAPMSKETFLHNRSKRLSLPAPAPNLLN